MVRCLNVPEIKNIKDLWEKTLNKEMSVDLLHEIENMNVYVFEKSSHIDAFLCITEGYYIAYVAGGAQPVQELINNVQTRYDELIIDIAGSSSLYATFIQQGFVSDECDDSHHEMKTLVWPQDL